jgi:hypothetical protein
MIKEIINNNRGFDALMEKHKSSSFVWVDAGLNEHEIEKMQTSHLYYTLRIIWNYLCPENLVVDKKDDYELSEHSIYNKTLLRSGILRMKDELLKRSDLTEELKLKTEFMKLNIYWLM